MKTRSIKDLMIALTDYATVSQDATLHEAVLALEEAQKRQHHYRHPQRAVLVHDDGGRIVGKLSMLDVLRALEPKYFEMGEPRSLSKAGFSPSFLKSMLEQYSLLIEPFNDICRKAAAMKVKDFMYTPSEGEYLEENASMREAIHHLVMGRHQSLLVTRGKDIVGILRLSDVFKEVFQTIRTCEL